MKIKLDENVPSRSAERLRALGHDVDTVPGTHCGILLVRVPDPLQWRLADYLTGWLGSAECESWSRCFVVATPLKVRVLRPE